MFFSKILYYIRRKPGSPAKLCRAGWWKTPKVLMNFMLHRLVEDTLSAHEFYEQTKKYSTVNLPMRTVGMSSSLSEKSSVLVWSGVTFSTCTFVVELSGFESWYDCGPS